MAEPELAEQLIKEEIREMRKKLVQTLKLSAKLARKGKKGADESHSRRERAK